MVTLALNSGLWVRRLLVDGSPFQGRYPASEVNDGGCPEKPDHLNLVRRGDPGQRASVRKLYRAWLMPGALSLQPGESLEIRTAIDRRPHSRLGWIWGAARDRQPGDLHARSCPTFLERCGEGDLVQVAIGSGRPHQIRIHCASVGAPLLGDPLYLPGGVADPGALPGDGGYRLQAWRLELQRPDGERLVLQVPQGLGEQGRPGS